MSNLFLQRATSQYVHPWFFVLYPCYRHLPSCLQNVLLTIIITHHTSKIISAFFQLDLLMYLIRIDESLSFQCCFFFDIFPTFRIFLTLTYGLLSASCSSTVLNHVFCCIELSISDSSYSRDLLICLLEF